MYSMEFRFEASNGTDIPAVLGRAIAETRQKIGIIDFLKGDTTAVAHIKAPTIYALQLLITELNKELADGHIAFVETGKIEED